MMKKSLILLLMLTITGQCKANVIINTTRIIYPAEQKEISVQLFNKGEQPALVQAWIDDGQAGSTPETAHVPFQLMPPVSKIDGKNGQQIRIRAMENTLPRDRESVFYLNVLDIPPEPESRTSANLMQVAIKSRIKFFYRPENLNTPPTSPSVNMTVVTGNQVQFDNPGPWFITVIGLKDSRGRSFIDEGVMVAPFSRKNITTRFIPQGNNVEIITIDDFGAYRSSNIKIH